MATKDRIRKPKLDRTQPIRSWSSLLDGWSARRDEPTAAPGTTAGKRPAAMTDVVSRSVELGYRVIDEYIRQGQRAAQRINDRSFGPDVLTNDVQEFSARMAQYASEFSSAWFELLQSTPLGGLGQWPLASQPGRATSAPPAGVTAAPEPAGGSGDARDHTRVKIAVASTQLAEVFLDLRPDAEARPLLVQPLRALDAEMPKITEVTVHPSNGTEPVTLRVRIPAGHPAGVYNGIILDEATSCPVGTVSVRVSAE